MGSKAIRRASDGVAEALRNIPGPVFAAAWLANSTDDTLIVHASATPNRSRLRNEILNAVRALGVARARVRFHNAARLASPRSLEKLVSRFAGDQIVYDPTGAVSRAKALVAASHSVRAALSEKVLGLYYAPRLRTFYVSLKAASVAVGDRVKVLDLAKIELAVKSSIAGAFASKIEECPAIRIGFGYPEASLVPVDQMSVVSFGTRMTTFVARRWKSVTLAALVGLGFGTPALARDPAVSEANLKITGQGGSIDDNDAWTGAGVFTAPLGETGGIALEGGASGVDGDRTIGAAGHLFIRDPDSYLLGVFGAYASEDDFNLEVVRVGAEAELYLNQISILASAGYQFSDIGHALVPVEDTAFGSIDLRWYATNNLALTVGGVFDEQRSIGTASVEWQPGFSALPGLAFNVNGEIGEDDYDSVMGGITYYFGSTASLKDRHRKQDPESALLNLFQSVEQERSRIAAIYGNPN